MHIHASTVYYLNAIAIASRWVPLVERSSRFQIQYMQPSHTEKIRSSLSSYIAVSACKRAS